MLRRVTSIGLCMLGLFAGAVIANAWIDGIYGSATDEAGRLLIHASAMSPELEDFVRSPDPYPAVYVVTDEMRVFFVQDGYFSDMAYAHFFDSALLQGGLTVLMHGSPRIESLRVYRERQLSDPGPDDIPLGGQLICTTTGFSMRCNRGAEVVYQHVCTLDPVGQTMVCRFQ